MAGLSVSDIAFPLSYTEATNHMTVAERQCTNKPPASATNAIWWLRSAGNGAPRAQRVNGSTGSFNGGGNVTTTDAVRPALWIEDTQSLYCIH